MTAVDAFAMFGNTSGLCILRVAWIRDTLEPWTICGSSMFHYCSERMSSAGQTAVQGVAALPNVPAGRYWRASDVPFHKHNRTKLHFHSSAYTLIQSPLLYSLQERSRWYRYYNGTDEHISSIFEEEVNSFCSSRRHNIPSWFINAFVDYLRISPPNTCSIHKETLSKKRGIYSLLVGSGFQEGAISWFCSLGHH